MPKCRACLSTEHNLVPFDNISIESYNLLTSLNVKESDGLPQALCEQCFNNIETFMTFRLNCINSEQILKEEYEVSKAIQGVSKTEQFNDEIKLEAGGSKDDDDMEADSFMGADDKSSGDGEDIQKVKNEDENMMKMEVNMDCVICNLPLEDELCSTVKNKGIKTLIKYSALRKDGLADLFCMVEEICLHSKCWRSYIKVTKNGTLIKLATDKKPVVYEYDRGPFDFNTKCFICTELACANHEGENPEKEVLYKLKDEITLGDIVKALKRDDCMKNLVILHRLENISLSQMEPRYHKTCYLQVMMPHLNITKKRPVKYQKPQWVSRSIQDLITSEPKFIENTSDFPFMTHCFFCAQQFKTQEWIHKLPVRNRKKYALNGLPWPDNRQKLITQCLENNGGDTYCLILQRIHKIDLKAIEARYHVSCYNYYVYKEISKMKKNTDGNSRDTDGNWRDTDGNSSATNGNSRGLGRAASAYVQEAMQIIYKHITENNLNHFDIHKLRTVLIQADCNLPCNSTIRTKLLEKYGDRITVTTTKNNMYVTFHDLA